MAKTLRIGRTAAELQDSYGELQVISGTMHLAESLTGEALSYDTASFVVATGGWYHGTALYDGEGQLLRDAVGRPLVAPPIYRVEGHPVRYPYGYTAVYTDDDGRMYWFYASKVARVGRERYRIDCISAVGVLAAMPYYGGIWLAEHPGTVQSVADDILAGTGIPYAVDADYAGQRVTGWLPISTRREALQQLLFAMGLNVRKEGQTLQLTTLGEARRQIEDGRIYVGGSVSAPDDVSAVRVTEHNYSAMEQEPVEIYRGSVAAQTVRTPGGQNVTGQIIPFDAPHHSLHCVDATDSTVTIIESGANYAVLPSTGGELVLTGVPYLDSPSEIVRAVAADTDKVASVSGATLVNGLNSVLVAERLQEYYSNAQVMRTAVVAGDELPGDWVAMTSPFGDTESGLVAASEISISATSKAQLQVVTDYRPMQAGNLYQRRVVLTATGAGFVTPEGIARVRIVLIGPGAAGEPGEPGAEGHYQQGGGTGGAGGAGGSGGDIWICDMATAAGDTILAAVSDTQTRILGALGVHSSTEGSPSVAGYSCILTGEIYAAHGAAGQPGGKGGDAADPRPEITYNGETWRAGETGLPWVDWPDGAINPTTIHYGGYGGGAAIGRDGNDGLPGHSEAPGLGGDGATPAVVPPVPEMPGTGGDGGHGGGGGGSGYCHPVYGNRSGDGGAGGAGGPGALGCVIIYY